MLYLIGSPLEQFVTNFNFKWSNLDNTYLIILLLFIFLIYINEFFMQYHIEWWYKNLKAIIPNYIFLIITIWLFIVLSNLIGMIPYQFTITAQFIIVLSITIPLFFSVNILGISLHKFSFFSLFLPSGVPYFIIPILSLLEFIAYFVRILSLTLRLTANMVAGHILIKILIAVFLNFPFALASFFLIPIIILEFAVAILQGYVYITLLISFYKDVLILH